MPNSDNFSNAVNHLAAARSLTGFKIPVPSKQYRNQKNQPDGKLSRVSFQYNTRTLAMDHMQGDYSRQTIVTMETISDYFVDIFYNELYSAAKQRKLQGESATITDGYKHALQAWNQSLDSKPIIYKKIRKGLCNHYMHYVSFITSWDVCINNMVKEFAPADYESCLTTVQKISILNLIIKNSNKEFIKRIVFDHFPIIIDSRTTDNALILKNEMIGILLLERDRMYQKFIVPSKPETDNKRNTTNVIEQLESQLKKLLKDRYEYTLKIIKLKRLAHKYMQENHALRNTLEQHQAKVVIPQQPIELQLPQPPQSEPNEQLSAITAQSQSPRSAIATRSPRPQSPRSPAQSAQPTPDKDRNIDLNIEIPDDMISYDDMSDEPHSKPQYYKPAIEPDSDDEKPDADSDHDTAHRLDEFAKFDKLDELESSLLDIDTRPDGY